ncbi:MAG: translocation/assembly module TamB domain-containing protein, partial [Pseudomonadota bacterium]
IAPESGEKVLLPVAGTPTEIERANLAINFNASQSEDWRAVVRLDSLAREGLQLDEALIRLNGQLNVDAAASLSGAIMFDVNGLDTEDGLSDAIGSDIIGNAQVDWNGGPVTINDFSLAARDLALAGSASIDGNDITVTTSFDAARLANFTTLAGRELSGQAALSVSGQINPLTQAVDLSVQGETDDLAIREPRVDAILEGTTTLAATVVRDTDGLRVVLTTLEGPAASLSGEASLRSGGSSVVLSGRLNQTALILPGLDGPSNISFSGQENEVRDWTISTSLNAPALSAEVEGLVSDIYDGPTIQGTLRAESPDLSAFSKLVGRALSGRIAVEAEGGTNTDLTRAVIDANVRGRDIEVEGLAVERVLQGPVTLSVVGGRTDDRIDITSFAFGGSSLIAQVAGVITDFSTTPKFDGSISARSPDLSVFAGLAQRPLSGELNLIAEGGGSADMSDARLRATIEGQDVTTGIAEADTLLRGALALNIDAARDNSGIEVNAFSLRTDALTAETSGQIGQSSDRLALRARLNDIRPFVPGFDGALAVDGTVGRVASALEVDIDADGPGGTRAAIAGTVAEDFSVANLSIEGIAPLALANRFIEPRSLAGTSRFDLRLNGAPSLNALSGRITLSEARLAAPRLPTGLENISGTIDLNGNQAILDIGSSVETGGRLSVSGPVGLTAPNSASLRIALSDVRVTDPRLYETTANGEIRVTGPLVGGASVEGAVNLGETNIQIPNTGLGGAGAIPEITHIREPPPVRGTRQKAGLLDRRETDSAADGPIFPLDVQVTAPNRIFVRGRGLDSEFGGGLRITGTTANIIPIGAFELIRGRLDILGQRLALQQARITVQGGLIPILDILATTDVEDTEISVGVLGPADAPEIRFTSSPELPQEEVLARLIFGRGLETLSPIQAARLAVAVRTLAGRGGEGIVGNIRGTAGLADLDVTTTEDGNAAVRAGAYIGEN